jgi:protein-S-isoprenylcysteine O-methyltransferase Ste14
MSVLISWNMVVSLWIVFLVYWALSALSRKRALHKETSAWRLATLVLVVAGASLIFSRSLHFGALDQRFVPKSAWIEGVAETLVAAGVGIAIWARRHLGQFWSARVTLKLDHQLIQSGPYAWVRHPIYSGLLLAITGTALFLGEWRAVVGTLLLFFGLWQKAWREEALLAGQFGLDYEEYRKRTGSLIPRLHGRKRKTAGPTSCRFD